MESVEATNLTYNITTVAGVANKIIYTTFESVSKMSLTDWMENKGEILAAILRNYDDCCFFLHNTRELNIAERILEEGFLFENQLAYSTDRVDPEEPIEVTYFLFQRKDYGPFTIIIAFNRSIFNYYIELTEKKNMTLEDILTISEPYPGDNDEMIYRLSYKHLLGYFDNNSSEFHLNSQWDPDYCNTFSEETL